MIVAIAADAAAGPFADQVALHLRRDGRAVDSEALRVGYEALCAAGTKLACSWRAWDDWGTVKREPLARMAEPACAAGDTDACVALALAIGLGDAADWASDHADRAEQLLADACRAHDARGCTECRSMRDHGALGPCSDAAAVGGPPIGSCDEGWLAACEAPAEAGDFDALERLCTAVGGDWCAKLAAGRVTVAGVGQDRAPDLAIVTPGGFLLGWRGPRFSEHALVPWAEVRLATLEVRAQKDEWLVLEPTTPTAGWAHPIPPESDGDDDEDEPAPERPAVVGVALPHDCAGVVAGVGALAEHRIPVVAKDADHGPARSACAIDAGLTYIAGEITVVPMDPSDDALAGDVRRALSDGSDGLFSCGVAAQAAGDAARTVDAEIKRARSGPAKSVRQVGGAAVGATGSAVETCVVAWLRSTPLGEADVPARFVVRVALDW